MLYHMGPPGVVNVERQWVESTPPPAYSAEHSIHSEDSTSFTDV